MSTTVFSPKTQITQQRRTTGTKTLTINNKDKTTIMAHKKDRTIIINNNEGIDMDKGGTQNHSLITRITPSRKMRIETKEEGELTPTTPLHRIKFNSTTDAARRGVYTTENGERNVLNICAMGITRYAISKNIF